MATASDDAIFDFAAADDRIVVSQDTDFGTILALRRSPRPSVILFRRQPDRSTATLAGILIVNLSPLNEHLLRGAVVVIDAGRIRIRALPITG